MVPDRGRALLRRVPRTIPLPLWAILILSLWGAVVVVRAFGDPMASPDPLACRFQSITGYPCGTCGATRALGALLDGDPAAAVASNPLAVAGGALMVLWLAVRVIAGVEPAWPSGRRARRILWLGVLALFLLNWGWVINRHGPGARPPASTAGVPAGSGSPR